MNPDKDIKDVFEEWAEEHHIDVTVVDVINKKETNYPNNI